MSGNQDGAASAAEQLRALEARALDLDARAKELEALKWAVGDRNSNPSAALQAWEIEERAIYLRLSAFYVREIARIVTSDLNPELVEQLEERVQNLEERAGFVVVNPDRGSNFDTEPEMEKTCCRVRLVRVACVAALIAASGLFLYLQGGSHGSTAVMQLALSVFLGVTARILVDLPSREIRQPSV
jgi:hypothetical protein